MATPLNIDTIAKLVIQPIPCDWNGCAATVNSWSTLQKHLQLHCHLAATGPRSKDNVPVTCQIIGCLDPEHYSLGILEEHINKSHLNAITVPCPALGCLYTAPASQGHISHFLGQHSRLLYINPQSLHFKLQASPLTSQLSSPSSLPSNSRFPSYKLVPYISATQSSNTPLNNGLSSLTKSIHSLRVSQTSEGSKLHKVQKYMASSTLKNYTPKLSVPTHIFTDLPLLCVTQRTSCCTLEVQHTNIPSNPQTDSILSAPPFWKLQTDLPIGIQSTVGYSTFVAHYEQSGDTLTLDDV
ncbi:hypothetical protein BJV78DRAFT_1218291, partial [Lactifluus subvellereus]